MNGPPPSAFPTFGAAKGNQADALTVVGLTVTYCGACRGWPLPSLLLFADLSPPLPRPPLLRAVPTPLPRRRVHQGQMPHVPGQD